ncbi:hypothetical protein BVY03_03750, partial [bacterium K02(2017)]
MNLSKLQLERLLKIGSCFIISLATVILYHSSLDNPIAFDSDNVLSLKISGKYFKSLFFLEQRWVNHLSFSLINQSTIDSLYFQRLFNTVLHLFNSILIMYLLNTLSQTHLFKDKTISKNQTLALASLAGLLFAVHSVSVYGIAYLIQRSIALSTMFAILSFIFYIKSLNQKTTLYLILSILAYFFSLHSKEHSVMLPLFLMAYTYIFYGINLDNL